MKRIIISKDNAKSILDAVKARGGLGKVVINPPADTYDAFEKTRDQGRKTIDMINRIKKC